IPAATGIHTGDSSVTIRVSPTARSLDTIQNDLSVNGGIGDDTLEVDDQNNPYSVLGITNHYQITDTQVSRPIGTGHDIVTHPITYAGISHLVLNTGAQADTVDVASTAAPKT